jgi:hypothetical protein
MKSWPCKRRCQKGSKVESSEQQHYYALDGSNVKERREY